MELLLGMRFQWELRCVGPVRIHIGMILSVETSAWVRELYFNLWSNCGLAISETNSLSVLQMKRARRIMDRYRTVATAIGAANLQLPRGAATAQAGKGLFRYQMGKRRQ